MPLAIPTAWQDYIQKAQQSGAWLWLWEITLDSTVTLTPKVAVVNNPTTIVCDGVTFYPFPVAHTPVDQSTDGTMPAMQLALDNTGRVLAPYVEDTEGFMDREVKLRLVNSEDLTQFFVMTFQIAGCTMTQQQVTLRLEIDNWFDRQMPAQSYHVHRCRHVFGSARCGYVINGFAAYTDCPKHLEACQDRGDDMVTRNLPRRQPESFGGFPGVPLS